MDSQSSLEPVDYNHADMSLLKWANLLLPTDEYSTFVSHFPGTNAYAYWAEKGDFYITFTIYIEGKEVGKFHTRYSDEEGYLEANFDEFLKFYPGNKSGIILADYSHHKKIFPELYLAHVHRKTGAYVSYPSQVFMGDLIYKAVHTTEIENSLFWPGAAVNERTEVSFLIINPYEVSSLFQVHLFLPDQAHVQTKTIKVQPYSWKPLPIQELFPEHMETIKESDGRCSFCIASQYKTVSLVMFKDKNSGAITTIDHLHRYCMY